MQPKRLYIVDAMAMAFRAFYAFGMSGRPLTTSAGLPVSALFGSAMFMNKLLMEQRPDYLAVACDSREKTFRHELYSKYKSNRTEMPADLAAQLPLFFRLLEAYGCPVLRQAGFEADDLIGSIVRRFAGPELEVYIVSGDKDFCQLVSDHTFLYIPKKGEEKATIVDRDGVRAKFGVAPEQVIDCLAIMGDASDNVPGVHGIGEKGAAKLIADFGTLEAIYASLERITNKKQRACLEAARDMAFLSRQLVTIQTDIELNLELAGLACNPATAAANAELLTLFNELEFRTLAARVEAAMRAAAPATDDTAADDTAATGLGAAQASAAAPASMTPERPIERIPDETPGYRLVSRRAELEALVGELAQADELCFDTETTGLDVVTDRPIGLSFSVRPGEAYYVPLAAQHLDDLDAAAVLELVRPLLTAEGVVKIGHNLKFDLQMLANAGIAVAGPFVDTMICDWLLDASSRTHGLDACCLRHLGYEKIPTSALIGRKAETPMFAVDLRLLTRYACEDADLTLRLHRFLAPRIREAGLGSLLCEIEMPLVPVLAGMERVGVHVDGGELQRLAATLGATQARLEADIHALAGEAFNINSPKQLSEILYTKLKVHEALGVRRLKKTQTGFSTDESVLARLAEHPLPKALLEYRAVAKLKGTYVDTLPTLVKTATGRIHTSYHQTGTATGRLSSSDPNLQNIPIRTPLGQEIRKAFRPSSPGWRIISADYSQVELRILAHMAGETGLAKAFAAKQDIHQATAAQIFGVAPQAVDPVMRSRAKAINFGILYGMGARRLAAETGTTLAEAASFIDRYFASYPGISRFIEATVAEAKSTGETRTITGRRRPVVGLDDANQRNVAAAENIAVNTRIQGSAADLIKLAMIAVDGRLRAAGLAARLLLQVHDELVLECPAAEVDKTAALVRYCMETAMPLSVPLDVEVGVGAHWLEAH